MTLLISPAYGPMVIIYFVSSTDGVLGGGVNIWDKRNRKPKTQEQENESQRGVMALKRERLPGRKQSPCHVARGSTQCQAVPLNFTR